MLNRRSFFAASAAGIAAGVLPRVEPLKQAMQARYPGPETQFIPSPHVLVMTKAMCDELRLAMKLVDSTKIHLTPFLQKR